MVTENSLRGRSRRWTRSHRRRMGGRRTRTGTVMNPLIRWFAFDHLKEPQRSISMQFSDFAAALDDILPDGAEKTVCLRKMLEAKDAAVRASLDIETR